LIKANLLKKLLKRINRQLQSHGLMIKESQGAVLDATLIESAARPQKTITIDKDDSGQDVVYEDGSSPGVKCEMRMSADPDATWLKKGKTSYFGYRGYFVADAHDGYVTGVHTAPANQSETTHFQAAIESSHTMESSEDIESLQTMESSEDIESLQTMESSEGIESSHTMESSEGIESSHTMESSEAIESSHLKVKRVYADKGSSSKENRAWLRKKKIKSAIMHKAHRNKPLTERQKLVNRLISKKRFIIEQCFGTLKRIFGIERASYFSTVKVNAQLLLKAICMNCLKAANKICMIHPAREKIRLMNG